MTVALDVATPTGSLSLELPPCSHRPKPYAGATREEVLALRRQHVNPALFTLYSEPVMLVEGQRQYVWDDSGRRYLDLFAGICTVACGHSHPKIVAAVQEQMALLAHSSTAFLHPNMPRFAEALLAKLPPELDRVYFVNSGSEANDLAIQMARLFTGHSDIVGIRNAYHGGSAPDRRPDRDPHLEVLGAARRTRSPRDQPRSLPQPVLRHAGADRKPVRRGCRRN